jgi:hypothetical protein
MNDWVKALPVEIVSLVSFMGEYFKLTGENEVDSDASRYDRSLEKGICGCTRHVCDCSLRNSNTIVGIMEGGPIFSKIENSKD